VSVRIPPDHVLLAVRSDLLNFIFALDRIPFRQGSAITSWWRDPAVNQAVGGSPLSQHLIGLALDVVTPNPTEVVAAAFQAGIVAIDERTHVHLQLRQAGSRETLRLITLTA